MKDYFFDLHMHSCLSPCGEEEMTPNNIVNMAVLKGLDIIALTDHNSCKNCPAILEVAKGQPITVLPGMELNTAEEIHVVFLFPDLARAMAFDQYVHDRLAPVKNRPDIFGPQLILDAQDQIIGEEPLLLVAATTISIDDTPDLARQFGGLCFPSHIDRSSNSIIAAFGYLPSHLGFGTVEVYRPQFFLTTSENREITSGFVVLTNSDAHNLLDIAEPQRTLPLPEPTFAALKEYLWAAQK